MFDLQLAFFTGIVAGFLTYISITLTNILKEIKKR